MATREYLGARLKSLAGIECFRAMCLGDKRRALLPELVADTARPLEYSIARPTRGARVGFLKRHSVAEAV